MQIPVVYVEASSEVDNIEIDESGFSQTHRIGLVSELHLVSLSVCFTRVIDPRFGLYTNYVFTIDL